VEWVEDNGHTAIPQAQKRWTARWLAKLRVIITNTGLKAFFADFKKNARKSANSTTGSVFILHG